jgi:N utilization substance protein B
MGRRRQAREAAFKVLYEVDLTGRGIEDAVIRLTEGGPEDADTRAFARDLLETVGARRTRLDEVLQDAAEHWSLDRMAVVDRALLRLGAAEILFWPWIPDEVSIDEYVEIAQKYGSEHSGRFVNGVLDRISREAREHS